MPSPDASQWENALTYVASASESWKSVASQHRTLQRPQRLGRSSAARGEQPNSAVARGAAPLPFPLRKPT